MKVKRLILLLAFLSLALPVFALDYQEHIYFSVGESGTQFPFTMQIGNPYPGDVSIRLTSACGCVVIEPEETIIPPNGALEIAGLFDSTGYFGSVDKLILIEARLPDDSDFIGRITIQFQIDGEEPVVSCSTCSEIEHLIRKKQLSSQGITPVSSPETDQGTEDEGSAEGTGTINPGTSEGLHGTIDIQLYYSAGCRECEELANRTIPRLSDRYGVPFNLETFDIMTTVGYEHLLGSLAELGIADIGELPLMIAEGSVYRGTSEITSALIMLAETVTDGGSGTIETTKQDSGTGSATTETFSLLTRLAPLPVFLAGLADGINPCAFSTLFFLLSVLTMVGRSRRQIAVTGLVFSMAVFITYFAVGLGIFTAFRALGAFSLAAALIRWVLFAALILLALLSLYDARLAARGKAKEMVLQLPDMMKKRIHKTIREQSRGTAIIGGALVTGILVSLFELACTGQVYLPAITYMTRTGQGRGLALLLIYNVGFIIPLLVVFSMVFAGISSKKAAALFQEHIAGTKIVLALVFLVMAALILVT